MASSLVLSGDLSLPLTAQTETFAILAQRGAGKSNTAAVMAEEMFAAGLHFVVIDPVGAWYGLRSSADGKSAGLAIPVFGGRHGDIPLTRTAGAQVASLIITRKLTAVLDLSQFESEAAKKQFLLDFARTLYRDNTEALHLFLEEADDYIPQRPMRDEAHLLRAFENLVRRGRSRGIGLTLITQRSASLNKNVLTQVGTLFAMRTTGPHDRAAVEEWVKYHLNSKDFLKSLPELKTGEAWVWSPSYLQITKRVQIRRRATFDSGATPGRSTTPAKVSTLADIDVAAVREQLAEVIEEAEQKDPSKLQAEVKAQKQHISQLMTEVRRLERDLDDAKHVRQDPDAHRRLLTKVRMGIEDANERLDNMIEESRNDLSAFLDGVLRDLDASAATITHHAQFAEPGGPVGRLVEVKRFKKPVTLSKDHPQLLTGMERAMLTALVQHGLLTKGQILLHTGYASSGPVSKAFASLSQQGFVEKVTSSQLLITAEGKGVLGPYTKLPAGEALREHLLEGNKLSGMEKSLLAAVFRAYPNAIAKGKILEQAGYASSGPVSKAFARLVKYGYAVKSGSGSLRAAEELF